MQNLIGIGVANATEDMRIRQSSFERVIFTPQRQREFSRSGVQNLEPTWIERRQLLRTANHI